MKINLANIKKAQKLLNNSECVAIPTETVYGLAANAYSDQACKRIFKLKKRPKNNPLIVHYYNIQMLKKYEKIYNFKSIITKPFKKNKKIISSTLIRKKIESGKIIEANKLLNREWSVEGKVIKGKKRGRKIGFPTCNLKLHNYVIPLLGVYAVRINGLRFSKKGIANIGFRPTFKGKNLLLETNIFGINKNLYNKGISVSFKRFIRREKKFKDLEHLKKQIKIDIKRAK